MHCIDLLDWFFLSWRDYMPYQITDVVPVRETYQGNGSIVKRYWSLLYYLFSWQAASILFLSASNSLSWTTFPVSKPHLVRLKSLWQYSCLIFKEILSSTYVQLVRTYQSRKVKSKGSNFDWIKTFTTARVRLHVSNGR